MYGYYQRPAKGVSSPFQLLYRKDPRMVASDRIGFDDRTLFTNMRSFELMARSVLRASKVDPVVRLVGSQGGNRNSFDVHDIVFKMCGTVFATAKWPALKPKFYGPGSAVGAEHLGMNSFHPTRSVPAPCNTTVVLFATISRKGTALFDTIEKEDASLQRKRKV